MVIALRSRRAASIDCLRAYVAIASLYCGLLLLSSQVFFTFDVVEVQKKEEKGEKEEGAPDNLGRSMLVKRSPGNSTCASKPLLRMVQPVMRAS